MTYHYISAFCGCGLAFFTNISIWNLQILASFTGIIHKGKITIIDINELIILATNVGHVHVVGGRTNVLVLFVGEDVQSDHVDLSVTVLACLGSGHFNDFAWATLDHDESIFAKS